MMAPTKSQNLSAAVDASRADKRRAGQTRSMQDRQNSNASSTECGTSKNKDNTSEREL
jgi:hypothetical protein